MKKELLDKRYKSTLNYIENNKGTPVFKKKAFNNINKILGPQYKWINKTPEEYFSGDVNKEAIEAIKILKFKPNSSIKDVRNTYIKLSILMHPDKGGHDSAFNILNYAYNLLKTIYEEEDKVRAAKIKT